MEVTVNPIFYKLDTTFININEICSISQDVKGSKCNAGYNQKDDLFLVIALSNGRNITILQESEMCKKFLEFFIKVISKESDVIGYL